MDEADDQELFLTALQLPSLRPTGLPVAPCMERSLGYPGGRRFVAFMRTQDECVYWNDGIDDGCANVAIWDSFIKHPLVRAHLHGCRFKGRTVEPEELTIFESSAEALRVELEECGDAMLLDREKRVVHTGLFARAFLCLVLATAHEEKPDDDGEDEEKNPHPVEESIQRELIEWLDEELDELLRNIPCEE